VKNLRIRIRIRISRKCWRLITFRTRRGHLVEFLTNEFGLEPGLVMMASYGPCYWRTYEDRRTPLICGTT